MDLALEGKSVIITGGTGGIGQGLVSAFAAEGANVVSASRDLTTGQALADEAKRKGLRGAVRAVQTDITDPASVDAMVDTARSEFGPIDVLVNNSGGKFQSRMPFEALDVEGRRWEIALNIDGVVNCTQAVGKDMLERGGGSIINISSNASVSGAAAMSGVHYGSVKGFVNSFSRGLAFEWGRAGVRINTICPGWIVPYRQEDVGPGSFWRRPGFENLGSPEDMQTAIDEGRLPNIANLPIRRLGRPEDVAYLALYLASDVSSYVTGQLISVSGGAYMP
ncbi:MAG: SDR family oxidoreductase [Actinobacteria bacterium]|nr:MAG: SDR family oxidoreductase [Actinomycetota bacterium]